MKYIVLPTYQDVSLFIYTSTMRYSKSLQRYICLVCETYEKGLTLIKDSAPPYVKIIVINGFDQYAYDFLKQLMRTTQDNTQKRFIALVPTTLRFMLPIRLCHMNQITQYVFLEARNLIQKYTK